MYQNYDYNISKNKENVKLNPIDKAL